MVKGIITTDKVSFSIDRDVNKVLTEYCENNLINKSKLVNNLIKQFIDLKIKEKYE